MLRIVAHKRRSHRHDTITQAVSDQAPPPRFIIRIRFVRQNPHGAETMRLKARATDSINYVKAKIQGIIRVPASQQRLVLLQMEGTLWTTLEDGQTLSDYSIQHGALLHLMSTVP